jgi:hypothetical protein
VGTSTTSLHIHTQCVTTIAMKLAYFLSGVLAAGLFACTNPTPSVVQPAEPSPAAKAASDRDMLAYTECIKTHAAPKISLSKKTRGHIAAYIEEAAESKECRPELLNWSFSYAEWCNQCANKIGREEYERQLQMLGQAVAILEYKFPQHPFAP